MGRTSGAKHIGILFFCLALAIVMTLPLAAHLSDGVLGPPGDNFEYLYKLWWFKHALFDRGISPFLNPDVFYPHGYQLALHEMSLAHIALGMPLTLLWGEVVSYNALVLLSFVLSAFGAYLLAYYLTGQRWAGLLCGIVFAFGSYRMAHLGAGHLNLLGSQWLPLLLLSVERLLAVQRPRWAILAGIFAACAALSSWYYAPMAAIACGVYLAWRGRPWRRLLANRRLWLLLGLAVAMAALLMLPSLIQTERLRSQREMAFSLQEVDLFSASVGDPAVANPMHPLWGRATALYYHARQDVPEHVISLSWTALSLSGAAIWFTRQRAARAAGTEKSQAAGWRITSAYALLLVVSLLLALGTTLHVNGQRVYLSVPSWLERGFTAVMGVVANRLPPRPMPSYYELRAEQAIYLPLPTLLLYLYVPFFDAMRVWTRFGLISALATAVLAGLGLAQLVRRARAPRRLWIGAICLASVLFELAVGAYPLGWSEVQTQPVDRWLAEQTQSGAVALFPLWKAEHGAALYATKDHGRPVVYGYGAFFPRSYRDVRPVLWDPASPEAIALLQKWDVAYVVVAAESYSAEWPELQRRLEQSETLELVATFNETPVYHSEWFAEILPDFGRAFIVDKLYVYRLA
jgi:hypothetical protein